MSKIKEESTFILPTTKEELEATLREEKKKQQKLELERRLGKLKKMSDLVETKRRIARIKTKIQEGNTKPQNSAAAEHKDAKV